MSATGTKLTEAQKFDWLRLIRSENIGPRTFRSLLNHFGGASAALDGLPDLVRSGKVGRNIKIASVQEIEEELEAAASLGVAFVALGEPEYPAALRAIDSAPPLITVRGRLGVMAQPMVAVVGSRNASAAGGIFTERLVRGVGRAGFVIVSGLARGIDSRAHQAALETGTVAVLAGGQDRIYPAENASLVDKIIENGAVLSEMPIGWEPRGRDFPRRNRIVSGLSLGTAVIEAARRSGSLITARFANEQGREVFAVPGSPLDPRAEGPNGLLRQGATLCTCAQDIIDVLAPLAGEPPRSDNLFAENEPAREEPIEPLWDELDLFGEKLPRVPQTSRAMEMDEEGCPPIEAAADARGALRDSSRERIVALLGPIPIAVDELVRAADAPVPEVHSVLLELELAGRLERHGGSLVSLV